MKSFLIAVAFAAFSSTAALALPVCPTTIAEPCTIATNGYHILGANIVGDNAPQHAASGGQLALEIGPGVTLASINCAGYSISNQGGTGNRGIGIYGTLVANVEIFNCNIFGNGMMHAIQIDNETQPAYQGVLIHDNVLSSTLIPIYVRSNNTTVTNNFLHDIGGQSIWSDAFPGAMSITPAVSGTVTVTHNHIRRLFNTFGSSAEVFGIACRNCYGSTISENILENDVLRPGSWALWINPGTYTIGSNKIQNFDHGVACVAPSVGTISNTTFINVNDLYAECDVDAAWTIN